MSHWTGRSYRQRGQAEARNNAHERGYEPHPDDYRPTPQHLIDDFNNSDWADAFERSVAEVRRLREERAS